MLLIIGLCQFFYFGKKIALFFFLLTGIVIVSIWMNALITVFVLVNIYEFDTDKMPASQFDFGLLTTGLYLVVLVGVSIHFVKEAFKQQNEKHRIKQEQAETSLLLQQKTLQNMRMFTKYFLERQIIFRIKIFHAILFNKDNQSTL